MQKTNEALVKEYRLTKSEEILNKLIEQNKGLITSIVKRYVKTIDSPEDAMQDGIIGLLEAIETFDATQSKFSTWAYFSILSSIRKGRKGGSDWSSEYIRKMKEQYPDMTLPKLFKLAKKKVPTLSKSFFILALQTDYKNVPEISLDYPHSLQIPVLDIHLWQSAYDIEQLLKDKPPIVQNIIHLMLQQKTQQQIILQLNISRNTLIHQLNIHFPNLVKAKDIYE